MARYSIKLEQLEDGIPSLFHQNALSYVFGKKSIRKLPSQLLFPNATTAIGLPPSSFSSHFSNNEEDNEGEDGDTENQRGTLLVFASATSAEIIKPRLFQHFIFVLGGSLLQFLLLLILYFVQMETTSRDIAIFILILLLDIALPYFIYRRYPIPIKLLLLASSTLAFVGFFVAVRSIVSFLFFLISPLKLYFVGEILFLIMPHVFSVSVGL